MMTNGLLIISMVLMAVSGVPELLLGRRRAGGQWLAAALSIAGSAVGGAALVAHGWMQESSGEGVLKIAVDAIGLLFLIPIYLVSALGAVYGLGYWQARRHPRNGWKLRLWWGVLAAAMALVVVARDGVLFLTAWEIMALSAYFLVLTEENKPAVREAAWIYLVAAHAGTLCLFAFFALLHKATGSFALWPALVQGTPGTAALFIVGTIGFALKAGVMPLHVWLPGAHANAPSHISAILSGVLLKMGVYGMVRIAALLPHPPFWWGATLLVAGTVSAVFGIAFAVGQRDIKRLLAYSSIENVGIIVIGIALATLGRSLGRMDWIVLGLGGALLHMLNHSLFKPLLFMGAGNVVHATGTREMDLLGGLGKKMPKTFVLFVIGALGICALPPLNGFVGELLLYMGLFRTALAPHAELGSGAGGGMRWGLVSLAAPALALVGALALASFVKLLGIVFAGTGRSGRAGRAHEAKFTMLAPMAVLAGCCIVIGVMPGLVVGLLDRAIAAWTAPVAVVSISDYVPMKWISGTALVLLAGVAAGIIWFLRRRPVAATRQAPTWGCGYARPTARMQYTGSSFSQMLVQLLGWVLLPRKRRPRPAGLFPAGGARFDSEVPDVVLDRALLPAFGSAAWLVSRARVIQRGPIQMYLLYILAMVLLLLLLA